MNQCVSLLMASRDNIFNQLLFIVVAAVTAVIFGSNSNSVVARSERTLILVMYSLFICAWALFTSMGIGSIKRAKGPRARWYNIGFLNLVSSVLFGFVLSLAYSAAAWLIVLESLNLDSGPVRVFIVLCVFFLVAFPLIEIYQLAQPGVGALIPAQRAIEIFVERVNTFFKRPVLTSAFLYTLFYVIPIVLISVLLNISGDQALIPLLIWGMALPMINLGVLAGTGIGNDLSMARLKRRGHPLDVLRNGIVRVELRERYFGVIPKIRFGGTFLLLFAIQALLYTSYRIGRDFLVVIGVISLGVAATIGTLQVLQTVLIKGRGAIKEFLSIWRRGEGIRASAATLLFSASIGVAVFINLIVDIIVNWGVSRVPESIRGLQLHDHQNTMLLILLTEDVFLVLFAARTALLPNMIQRRNLVYDAEHMVLHHKTSGPIGHLLAALHDLDAEVRRAAIDALATSLVQAPQMSEQVLDEILDLADSDALEEQITGWEAIERVFAKSPASLRIAYPELRKIALDNDESRRMRQAVVTGFGNAVAESKGNFSLILPVIKELMSSSQASHLELVRSGLSASYSTNRIVAEELVETIRGQFERTSGDLLKSLVLILVDIVKGSTETAKTAFEVLIRINATAPRAVLAKTQGIVYDAVAESMKPLEELIHDTSVDLSLRVQALQLLNDHADVNPRTAPELLRTLSMLLKAEEIPVTHVSALMHRIAAFQPNMGADIFTELQQAIKKGDNIEKARAIVLMATIADIDRSYIDAVHLITDPFLRDEDLAMRNAANRAFVQLQTLRIDTSKDSLPIILNMLSSVHEEELIFGIRCVALGSLESIEFANIALEHFHVFLESEISNLTLIEVIEGLQLLIRNQPEMVGKISELLAKSIQRRGISKDSEYILNLDWEHLLTLAMATHVNGNTENALFLLGFLESSSEETVLRSMELCLEMVGNHDELDLLVVTKLSPLLAGDDRQLAEAAAKTLDHTITLNPSLAATLLPTARELVFSDDTESRLAGATAFESIARISFENADEMFDIAAQMPSEFDSNVRASGLLSLGYLASRDETRVSASLKIILRHAEDDYWKVRFAVANALSHIASVSSNEIHIVFPVLIKLGADEDDEVRGIAGQGILIMALNFPAELAKHLDRLIELANHWEDELRYNSLRALSIIVESSKEVAEQALPILIELCSDPVWATRAIAAEGLMRISVMLPKTKKRVHKEFLKLLADPDEAVRSKVFEELLEVSEAHPQVFEDILQQLYRLVDMSETVKAETTGYLIKLVERFPNAAKDAMQIAKLLVRDKSPIVRASTARLVEVITKADQGQIPIGLEFFMDLLDDPTRDVRLEASRSMDAFISEQKEATEWLKSKIISGLVSGIARNLDARKEIAPVLYRILLSWPPSEYTTQSFNVLKKLESNEEDKAFKRELKFFVDAFRNVRNVYETVQVPASE